MLPTDPTPPTDPMLSAELIAFRNDATGERAALTAAELGGWTAATAALLVDECGLGPGARAAVLLPPHWQTAAVLLGAWSAGVEVAFRGWATAGLAPAGDPLDVSFVQARRVGNWLDEVPSATHQFVLGLAPSAAPVDGVPDGYRDFPTAVRPHLGAAPPQPTTEAHRPAGVDGTTFGEYGAVAAEIAAVNGIARGDRVLVDAAKEDPLFWLLAPLSVGASVVICHNLDRARLDATIAEERATRVLA
ncbi:MAG: TIGR03089 family protein [Actinoplanes sp.]